MQILNKTEQIANLQGKNRLERRDAVQDILIATPHPATGVHNESDVLSNQKTDLGSRGDHRLLVYDLHGISSGL